MNYTLQLHGERMLYQMPPGLYELMSDISREVLRDQPTLVYKYIADYLDTLVKVREYSRRAAHLVSDIIEENRDLIAYVDSLGLPWEEANIAATKIQTAFRKYRKINEIKLQYKAQAERIKKLSMMSESFQEFLKTLDLNIEEANRASSVIQSAYRTFMAKKQLATEFKESSTHTVDAIIPKPAPELTKLSKAPFKRNSKLLVYEESPRHSVESTWSALRRQLSPIRSKAPYKRDSKLLTYEESPRHSVESTWSSIKRQIAEEEAKYTQTEKEPAFKLVYEQGSPTSLAAVPKSKTSSFRSKSSYSTEREGKITLPSYYDENQPRVPMISETGQLEKDVNDDIVTLYSTDAMDEERTDKSEMIVKLPSFSNLSFESKPMKAKELFDVIENRSSKTSRFIHSADPLDEEVLVQMDGNIKRDVSKLSNDKRSIQTNDLINHSGKIASHETKKTSSLKEQSATDKSSKSKVDFIKEN